MLQRKEQWDSFKKENGFGLAVFDDFLDKETTHKLYQECLSAPEGGWTLFSRAGSRMEEFNDLINSPIAHRTTYSLFHSGEFLYELEQLTGHIGLMPDPHLVGAGFSIIRNGSHLGCHYDFNWNDRLRVHRTLTSLLYISPDWKEEYGGHIEYWDNNIDTNSDSKLIKAVAPMFNRFVVNENIKEGPYHRVREIKSPEDKPRCAIRFFYYLSDSEYKEDDPPHKSIYKSNEYTHHKLYN